MTLNKGIILIDTPHDVGSSDDAEPNPHLPMSESLKDRLFSEGYDSDGLRIKYDVVAKVLYESANYNDIKVEYNGIDEVVAPIAAAVPAFVLISNEDIAKLKVDSLRVELKKLGLSRKGSKAELINCLKKAMIDKVPIQNENGSELANTNVFAKGLYWKVLQPDTTEVEDPTRIQGANSR